MNVLLIHDSVREYQVFVDSVNENTFPFVYGTTTTRVEFRDFLKDKNVNRLAIVFEIGDLLLGETFFNSVDYLNSLNLSHLDFLACNTLQLPVWKDFYSKLTCVVGASNNPTGNLQYGGDWILESTCEDVESIYFTKSIQYYTYLLGEESFSYILKDGKLWATGLNSDGQLGTGNTTNLSTYTNVTQYQSDLFKGKTVQSFHCGYTYVIVLMTDNTLWGVGANSYSAIGVNPVGKLFTRIPSFSSSFIAMISCGKYHTMAITDDNNIWATGMNVYGQLGTGNTGGLSTFTKINTTITGKIKSIACGNYFNVILSDNKLWVSGSNDVGQLGTGDKISPSVFTVVNIDTLTGKIPITLTASDSFTMVAMSDGSIWGAGTDYRLGVNSISSIEYTTFTMALNTNNYFNASRIAVKVRSGYTHTLALMSDGTVWTTGTSGGFSAMATTSSRRVFTQMTAPVPIKSVYAINYSTILLGTDNTTYVVGQNNSGQLGIDAVNDVTSITLSQTNVTALADEKTNIVSIVPPLISSISPLTGTTNTVLTISGTDLTNVTTVLFNQISVTPTSTGPTSITVSVPVNRGMVTISVVDNKNNISTSPTSFTYLNTNQPSTSTLTNFNTPTRDLQAYVKNTTQMITLTPDVTRQTKSAIKTLSVYKKNITVSTDGSPSGETVITFGNRTKRVGWVACGHGTTSNNTLAYSRDGLTWSGLGKTIFTSNSYAVTWNGTLWIAGGDGTNTLAYSYDGIKWTGLGTQIFTSFVYGLQWNQIMCIATGGGNNSIAYSYDGLNWIGIGNTALLYGYSVGWNGHMWIVTGESSLQTSMVYSYDGIQWIPVTDFYTKITNGLAVSWNGKMWVAGGSGTNSLAYSYNGLTWTGINSNGLIGQVRGIAWNGTLWVAVGFMGSGNCTIVYSYDGIIWTGVTNSNTLTSGYSYRVSWNGTMFIATGAPPNSLLYSYDGIRWIGLGTTVFANHCRDICHSNRYENSIVIKRRRIIAGGDGLNTLAYSTDGINWTGLGNTLLSSRCYGIAYNGRIWVAVGSGNTNIVWSLDGQSWYSVSTSLYDYGLCIAWNGKMWVSGGGGTHTILYSYDGLTWKASTNSKSVMTTQVYSIDWNGSIWLAVGVGTTCTAYSYDGITWIAGTNVFSGSSAIKVVWNGTLFLAAGNGTTSLAYSYDGINNWIPVSSTINGHGLAWNGTMWMASDGSYSYDAKNWTIPSSVILNSMYVIWTGSLWVNVGLGYMAYSYDGIQWTNIGAPVFIPASGYGVCIASDLYNEYTNTTITLQTPVVAVGSTPNSIAYSNDGIQWTGLGNFFFTGGGYAIAYSGSRWVAGGKGSHTLAYSDDGIYWIGLGASIFTTGCFDIAYNGSIWVAVGTGTNTIAYSTDGKRWTGYTNTFFTIANTVAWNGTRWIVGGGYTYSLATSTDGKTWTGLNQTSGIGLVNGLEYNGTMWIAAGLSNNTEYNVNGLTWSSGISWSSGITWTNGLSDVASLAIMAINQIPLVYSYDSLNWYNISNSILTQFESIAWNGKMWIAVGVGPFFSMTYSYDGITWTGISNSYALFPSGATGITWNGLRWIAVGNGTTDSMAYSNDGILWNGLGKTIMGNGYGIGPRIFDVQLGMGDDLVRFSTDTYYQQGYSNLTIGIANEYNQRLIDLTIISTIIMMFPIAQNYPFFFPNLFFITDAILTKMSNTSYVYSAINSLLSSIITWTGLNTFGTIDTGSITTNSITATTLALSGTQLDTPMTSTRTYPIIPMSLANNTTTTYGTVGTIGYTIVRALIPNTRYVGSNGLPYAFSDLNISLPVGMWFLVGELTCTKTFGQLNGISFGLTAPANPLVDRPATFFGGNFVINFSTGAQNNTTLPFGGSMTISSVYTNNTGANETVRLFQFQPSWGWESGVIGYFTAVRIG